MAGPVISVVVPVYRPGPWLAETLASAAAQACGGIEIVVVDDGNAPPLASPEAGPATLIRQAHAGVSAARNRGLAAARGAFVAFLDADDLWLPGSAAALLAHLRDQPGTGAAHGRTRRFTAGAPGAAPEFFGAPYYGHNTGSLLFRREAIEEIGGFDARYAFGEDFDALLRLQEAGIRRDRIDALVLLYRRGHGSTTERAGVAEDRRASLLQRADALAANLARRRARKPGAGWTG
jgi:glycosyltransferase involved in cell wall biosynthesis